MTNMSMIKTKRSLRYNVFTNRVFFTQAEKRCVEKEQKPRWFQQGSPLWFFQEPHSHSVMLS